MKNPFTRKPRRSDEELERLYTVLLKHDPSNDEYETVLNRINELDRIDKRSSELTKTVIPALGTVAGVGGIYAIQQFGGLIVPKALDAIASRSQSKNRSDND